MKIWAVAIFLDVMGLPVLIEGYYPYDAGSYEHCEPLIEKFNNYFKNLNIYAELSCVEATSAEEAFKKAKEARNGN